MKKLILSLLAASMISSMNANAADAETVEGKMKALEDVYLSLDDEIGDLNKRFNQMMSVSGYTDVEYIASTKDDTPPGFRMHHLSLFFKQQVSDDWRFFSEIEYEDAPYIESDGETTNAVASSGGAPVPVTRFAQVNGKIFVEAVNLDYTWREDASFRIGRFFTPAGIWSIDHYPPFVVTQERPKHIRNIFPQVVDGVMAYGMQKLGSNFLSYNLYTGNGEGNTGQHDHNSSKATGMKLNLALPIARKFDIGASYYKDTLNDTTDKMAYGVHSKIQMQKMTFQAEYAKADCTPQVGSSYDRVGYYAQLSHTYNKWLYGYRYDFYDKDSRATDRQEQATTSLFVNYRMTRDVLLKLENHQIDETSSAGSETNYNKAIMSVAVNLGN